MAKPSMPLLPEQQARERIDAQLMAAGWTVQFRNEINLHAAQSVVVREFPAGSKNRSKS
jgi:type I restriction enzyme R subunit